MKKSINLFFDSPCFNKLISANPELFTLYDSWAFKSTMPIDKKLELIAWANTKIKILEAIIIFQNNYCLSKIKERNTELESYLKQRMDSS